MPGGKSDYLEAEILDHVLGGADFVRPTTVYLALSTTTPTDAGGITEPSGGAYARQAITNDATNFPAASGTNPTEKKNGTVVTFPVATAAWGTIVGWALFDAATAGNMLYWGDVTPSKTVGLDDQPKFAVNGLKVTYQHLFAARGVKEPSPFETSRLACVTRSITRCYRETSVRQNLKAMEEICQGENPIT